MHNRDQCQRFSLNVRPLRRNGLQDNSIPFHSTNLVLRPDLRPTSHGHRFRNSVQYQVFIFHVRFSYLRLTAVTLARTAYTVYLQVSSRSTAHHGTSGHCHPRRRGKPSRFYEVTLRVEAASLERIYHELQRPPTQTVHYS